MTSITDSIVNSVVLISVLLVLSFIIITLTIESAFQDGEEEMQVFLEARSDAAVDSFLLSTYEGESMRSLLGEAIMNLRTEIDFEGEVVDLVAESESRLEMMFGEDNYYFELEPVIKGVNFMFVIDASPSLSEEIAVISQEIGAVQEQIQDRIREEGTGEEIVSVQVFVLPGASIEEGCGPFEAQDLPNMECQVLTTEQLYSQLLARGWELPSFGYESFEEWDGVDHFASLSTLAESDWAAGVAYAARSFEEDTFLQQQASLNFIFPLGDELATSSKADECFNVPSVSEFIVCQLCDDGCDAGSSAYERSEFAVEQAVTQVSSLETNSRVFPIYSVECNYQYEPGYNQLSSQDGYPEQFVDDAPFSPDEYPETTWCSQQACGACEYQGGDFCFQNQCWESLQEQMDLLAQETGGNLINAEEVGDIPQSIEGSFEQAIEEFDFEVGTRNETRDRFVHEKIVQLPNGFLTRVRLWTYQD